MRKYVNGKLMTMTEADKERRQKRLAGRRTKTIDYDAKIQALESKIAALTEQLSTYIAKDEAKEAAVVEVEDTVEVSEPEITEVETATEPEPKDEDIQSEA